MIRNILVLLTALLCICGNSWATDYTQDANCQGARLFAEGSGITVADSSQNTNTGNFKSDEEPAWASMAGVNAPSYAPYRVDFDGTDDYIENSSGGISIGTTENCTIVLWINIDNIGGTYAIHFRNMSGYSLKRRCHKERYSQRHNAVKLK